MTHPTIMGKMRPFHEIKVWGSNFNNLKKKYWCRVSLKVMAFEKYEVDCKAIEEV
jgi:hypothetical protein